MRIPFFIGLGLLLGVSLQAQQPAGLRARELFYTPIADVKPAPAKEAATKDPAPKAAASKSEAPKSATATAPKTQVPAGGARIQNASLPQGQAQGTPLALKYRLLKRNAEGRYDEVETDTEFRSGDMIRVSVESNDNAYLYIVQRGSSQTWDVLFPNDATEQGSNHVQRNREYEIPGGGRYRFDEQPGEERLFIVLSRKAEPDLENLIYALSQGGAAKLTAGDKPGSKPKLMLAQNKVDDSLIDRLRGKVLARDLVFEKVSDDAPVNVSGGIRKEKAMYVASTDRGPNAQVVVDLSLKHR